MNEKSIDVQQPSPESAPLALPPGMTRRRFVSTAELAEALDCDPRTLVKAAKAGKIPALRIAGVSFRSGGRAAGAEQQRQDAGCPRSRSPRRKRRGGPHRCIRQLIMAAGFEGQQRRGSGTSSRKVPVPPLCRASTRAPSPYSARPPATSPFPTVAAAIAVSGDVGRGPPWPLPTGGSNQHLTASKSI